jgi:hypothetical protein
MADDSSITIDKETTKQISDKDTDFNEGFRNFLKENRHLGVYHYGFDDAELGGEPQFVLDGEFDDNNMYIEDSGRRADYELEGKKLVIYGTTYEDSQKVADAIRAYIDSKKPVEKASEPAEKASEPAAKASEPAAKPPPPPGPPPFYSAPKPSEPAGPSSSRVNRFRTMVSTASAQGQVKGGRKTRAKKEPKRKTRKAKKSTRRR